MSDSENLRKFTRELEKLGKLGFFLVEANSKKQTFGAVEVGRGMVSKSN